jgi:predicted DNA-binding transcriptional regulator AlpA
MSRAATTIEQPIEPRGLSRGASAAYLGIGTTLFDELVEKGEMPKSGKLSGRVVWDRRALDKFFDKIFEPASEANKWANFQ